MLENCKKKQSLGNAKSYLISSIARSCRWCVLTKHSQIKFYRVLHLGACENRRFRLFITLWFRNYLNVKHMYATTFLTVSECY